MADRKQRRNWNPADAAKDQKGKERHDRRGIRRAHLPHGKRANQAGMMAGCAVGMQAFMEGGTNRKRRLENHQHRQRSGQRGGCDAVKAGKFSHQSHERFTTNNNCF